MSTRQLPSSLLDCKPPTVVDTPAAVYADSTAGNGNGRSASCPDDVREMHKYYWERVSAEGAATDAELAVQQQQLPGNQLPPELRHDDYSPATGSVRLLPKLMPYGLPVCGDSAAAKLLTNASPNEYYQTSAPAGGGYMAQNDYVAYGYSPGQDMTSVMVANAGYHHQAMPGYPCQKIPRSSSPTAAAQFADVKAGLLPHGNTAELYQWVREQQHYAAANAIGISTLCVSLFTIYSNSDLFL